MRRIGEKRYQCLLYRENSESGRLKENNVFVGDVFIVRAQCYGGLEKMMRAHGHAGETDQVQEIIKAGLSWTGAAAGAGGRRN
jgi:hypothetical protein